MNQERIHKLFESFQSMRVMIVGDVMIDSYLWGNIDRISPEAPVPVVDVVKREKRLGGAANVARNVKTLGADCVICTVVGNDVHSDDLIKLLNEDKIRTTGVIKSDARPTTMKHRILSGSQQILRVDEESKHPLNSDENNKLLHSVLEHIEQTDVLILQDYDKGVLNSNNIERIIEIAQQHNVLVTVDPKKKNFELFKGVDLFKPNFKEICDGLNLSIGKSEEDVKSAVEQLKEKIGAKNVLLTLSEKGVYVDISGEQHLVPTEVVSVADVSGAGDTVIAVVSMGMTADLKPAEIGVLSNIAGGLVCQELGVVPINGQKLKDKLIEVYC